MESILRDAHRYRRLSIGHQRGEVLGILSEYVRRPLLPKESAGKARVVTRIILHVAILLLAVRVGRPLGALLLLGRWREYDQGSAPAPAASIRARTSGKIAKHLLEKLGGLLDVYKLTCAG